jgi:hypothetical protein
MRSELGCDEAEQIGKAQCREDAAEEPRDDAQIVGRVEAPAEESGGRHQGQQGDRVVRPARRLARLARIQRAVAGEAKIEAEYRHHEQEGQGVHQAHQQPGAGDDRHAPEKSLAPAPVMQGALARQHGTRAGHQRQAAGGDVKDPQQRVNSLVSKHC